MAPGHKILVVTEDPDRCDRIRSILTQHHYAHRYAMNGGKALRVYEQWPAELVISDYRLSGLETMQIVDLIRRMNQRARFVLIIDSSQELEFRQVTPNRVVAYLRDRFTDLELLQYIQRGLGTCDEFYNRRRYSRYKLAIDTHTILINPFTNSESRPIAGLIRDVSRSGLSMLVRQVLPVPAMLKLVLDLPQTRQSITMLAKSLSCTLTQMPNVYRLGAKFVGLLPPEMEQAIAEWDAEHPGVNSDLFMGKTFKQAVHEWLTANQDVLNDNLGDGVALSGLVEEVCSAHTETESD